MARSCWTTSDSFPTLTRDMFRPTERLDGQNVVAFKRPMTVQIECKDNLEFMRALPEGSMKLIVTSPPYNIGKEYERRTSIELYVEQQVATIAEAARLLHAKGSICWQVGNHVDDGEIFMSIRSRAGP